MMGAELQRGGWQSPETGFRVWGFVGLGFRVLVLSVSLTDLGFGGFRA